MLEKNFSVIDYCVFIGLLVASSLIGVYFAWKSRRNATNSEFFTGDRKLGLFPVTMSLVASFMSTNTLLGLPAEVFQMGTQFSLQIIGITISVILAAEVFMPVFYHIRFTSVNEYLAERYGSKAARLAGTIGFLCATLPYMAVVLYGPSLALSSVTPLSIRTSIIVVGTICTFYTSIGGIKAVIWTDVLQCILMFLGVTVVIIQGANEVGGLGETWRINERGGRLKFFNMDTNIYRNDTFIGVFLTSTITWGACYCAMQTQVQRYCSMESAKTAKKTLYWNLPGLIILAIMSIMCGMVIYAKYHNCDPVTLKLIERYDQLMPFYVMDSLSKYKGLPGLFVACVFSGSLSTLSSGFNALAAVTWEDILKERLKNMNEKKAVRLTKLIAMGYGILAIVMSFGVGNAGNVLQASIALVGSMMGPLFAFFIIALFYPYATTLGSIFGLISGIGLSFVLSIGAVIYPRPKISLPTTIESCPSDVIEMITKMAVTPTSAYMEHYTPEGSARLFHISYLYVSTIGFTVTLVIGLIASLLIGKRPKIIDPNLMSPLVKYIFPCYKKTQLYPNDKKLSYKNGSNIEGVSYKSTPTETALLNQTAHA